MHVTLFTWDLHRSAQSLYDRCLRLGLAFCSSSGLISVSRSFMHSDSAYVFRSSPPASLPLTRCFTLTDVTAGSQAPSFTITTASSAGPRPITCHVVAKLRA
jgi:hypothetical protein